MGALTARRWWIEKTTSKEKISRDMEAAESLIYESYMHATSLDEVDQKISEAIRALRRVQAKVRKEARR